MKLYFSSKGIVFCVTACMCMLYAAHADAAFWRSGLWTTVPHPGSIFSVVFRVNRSDLSELQIGGATMTCTDDSGSYDWTITLTARETQLFPFYINNGHIDGSFEIPSGAYEGLGVFMSGDLSGGRGELYITLAVDDNDLTSCVPINYYVQVRRAGFFQRLIDLLTGR